MLSLEERPMKRKDYKKKKSSGKRLAMKISLLVTLTAFLVVVAYGISLKNKAVDAADKAYEAVEDRLKSELRAEAVKPITDNVSILFMGVDESEKRMDDGHGRSDALLVATLNNKAKTVKLVSIPRDSYVYIPDRGKKDKITHAHAFGGTRGTIETVEGMLDIPIDYYVKMNFNAFIEIVDALGGIDLDVNIPREFVELDENDQRVIQLKPGQQHLDGQHALALARTRKIDSDVQRGKRQQDILHAILKETASVKSITKYGDVIDAVGNNMKTNMKFDEMTSFLAYIKSGIPQVDMISLEGTDDMSTGTYYWMLDEDSLEQLKSDIQTHLGVSRNSSLTNGSNNNSNAGEATN